MGNSKSEKNSWVKMRKAFGIADLAICIFFMILIVTSDGGVQGNQRMLGASWFFAWCGILQMFGSHRKGFTIASIVFYAIGILYNLSFIASYPAHLILAVLMTVFLILTSVSISDKASFYK